MQIRRDKRFSVVGNFPLFFVINHNVFETIFGDSLYYKILTRYMQFRNKIKLSAALNAKNKNKNTNLFDLKMILPILEKRITYKNAEMVWPKMGQIGRRFRYAAIMWNCHGRLLWFSPNCIFVEMYIP